MTFFIVRFLLFICKVRNFFQNKEVNPQILGPHQACFGSTIKGDLEFFSVNQNLSLIFKGWTPITWKDDGQQFFAGLPIRPHEEIVVIVTDESENSHEEVFSPHELADWSDFFQKVNSIFRSDSDFCSDIE